MSIQLMLRAIFALVSAIALVALAIYLGTIV